MGQLEAVDKGGLRRVQMGLLFQCKERMGSTSLSSYALDSHKAKTLGGAHRDKGRYDTVYVLRRPKGNSGCFCGHVTQTSTYQNSRGRLQIGQTVTLECQYSPTINEQGLVLICCWGVKILFHNCPQ